MSATTHQTLDEILNLLREKRRDKWWWLKSILQYPRIVVSPGPYLSFLHSIISLPLGALYFAATWILLGAGCVTFVIGIGLLLLVLMSLGLKAMTIIELFLAKHLLKFTLYRSASFVVSNCSKTNKTRPNNKNIISNNPALNRSNIGIGGGDINGIIIDNIGSNNGLIGRPTPLPYANSVNYSAYDEIGVDLHCSNKKKLSEKVKDLVFSAETGFGLLFTVVKVPVCVIVLALSVLFVLLPLFLSSGIGAATAIKFSELGHPLLLLARRLENMEKPNLPNCLCRSVDVTDYDAFDKVVKEAEAQFGPTSLLVNNAGCMLLSAIQDQDPCEWKRMLDCNVLGVLNGMKAVLNVSLSTMQHCLPCLSHTNNNDRV
eukprot:GEZU01005367.1.p1 GENE.GEZU01005367.1~~GEZU01005367.1.p1  ORF type:complete len:373 (+),score=60.97 GEZU01005367.1:146-1264(+)